MSEATNRLRVLVFGAGAIGTYVGGSLALQGLPGHVCRKDQKSPAFCAERGMRLQLGEKKHKLKDPTIAESLSEALERDLLMSASLP